MSKEVLVTGGAGYIGSHTVLLLLEAGFDVIVIDNLSNGHIEALRRVEALTGRLVTFYESDLSDSTILDQIFSKHRINSVVHFAGLKAVGESLCNPLKYYINNVASTMVLLESMAKAKVHRLVFSSSATVYGQSAAVPYKESYGRGFVTNPYGATKAMIEQILDDLAASGSEWEITSLRYFNPVGAHSSGLIGEDPKGVPNNLMPFVSKVAVGKLAKLSIFGGDYPTPDGTCRRDFIHVMDLAEGHLHALSHLKKGSVAVNLGTGKATSVLEIVNAFQIVSGVKVPYEIIDRRVGDLADVYADASRAKELFGWVPKRGLNQMVEDIWRWQRNNPNGFNYC